MEEWLVKNTKLSKRDGSIVNVPLMGCTVRDKLDAGGGSGGGRI